jgi:ABC-2 type transport system ATP-binding protein
MAKKAKKPLGKGDDLTPPSPSPNSERGSQGVRSDLTIQVKGVTKAFGSRVAVNNLSFDVRRGEVVGFLGPNGAGKTTTMRLLTSYYTQDSGTILINGVDNQERDLETRNSIGYLPENNPLYGDLLVKEYLAFVADLRGIAPAQRRESMAQAVEEAGLKEVYYRPVSQLSKGYRQRVGLAQAILHRPSILVMDEPTEGLDPNQRVTIRELIRTMGKDRTVLLSTHVMQEVEATCERVLIIRRGQLVADSPIKELLNRTQGMRSVQVEVEGNEVETALKGLPNVTAVERQEPVDGRKRYRVAISGDEDIRPEIFHLARKRDWVLWELHEERARLEDIFHALTTEPTPE